MSEMLALCIARPPVVVGAARSGIFPSSGDDSTPTGPYAPRLAPPLHGLTMALFRDVYAKFERRTLLQWRSAQMLGRELKS